HCIAVCAVGSIEHEIVASEIRGGAFLGLNRTRFGGHFRPNRSDLFVQSWRDHLVGTLERLSVNRVDVSLIVYEPVPSLAALGATPFQVREPVRIEVQAYRGYEGPLFPSVLPHRGSPVLSVHALRVGYDIGAPRFNLLPIRRIFGTQHRFVKTVPIGGSAFWRGDHGQQNVGLERRAWP